MTFPLSRHAARQVHVGPVCIGGDAPIVIQAMTNTDTADQVARLARTGAELVRVAVNDENAAAQIPRIRERLDQQRIDVPLIGDFHFNGRRLLSRFPDCAQALAKYRGTPGNVGHGAKRSEQFCQLIEIARRYGKPVRIGVNWDSLAPDLLARMTDANARLAQPCDASAVMRDALVASVLENAAHAIEIGLPADRIVLSAKVSQVQDLIAVYRALAARCDYPLHVGLTEAGMGSKGIVAFATALAVLLQQGIGATPSASRSRPSRTAIARARCWSPNRSCSRWGCARLRRQSRPAPAADERPAPSFRRWRATSSAGCASRRPDRGSVIRASSGCTSPSWGVSSMARAKAGLRTSVFRCRVPANVRPPRSISKANGS